MCLACIIIAIILAITMSIEKRREGEVGCGMKISLGIVIATFTLFLCGTGLLAHTVFIAQSKGATWQNFETMSSSEIVKHSEKSPVVETINKANPGDIIILTRYGCKDCQEVIPDVNLYIREHGVQNVHFISSQSDYGKQLVEKLSITQVPCAVYVRHAPASEKVTMNKMTLYSTVHDGGTAFNENGFTHLVQLQRNGA